MPELPEVETVLRGLEPVMMGQKIRNADIRRPDLRWPFPENMSQRLTGAKILRLHRRSKYILNDDEVLKFLLQSTSVTYFLEMANVNLDA